MDIKEHYITSIFFHVIALMLAAAFSQSHLKTPDTLAISLSADSIEQSSATGSAKAKEIHEIMRPIQQISNDKIATDAAETTMDKEVTTAEEPVAVSTTEKTPEVLDPVVTGMPDPGQEAMWLAQIHHAYIKQTHAFMDNFLQSIQKGLSKAIETTHAGSLREGTAEVTFYFNDEGGFGEVWGATNSEVLELALKRLDWQSVPLPGAYRINIKGLNVRIRIEGGEPSLSFTML